MYIPREKKMFNIVANVQEHDNAVGHKQDEQVVENISHVQQITHHFQMILKTCLVLQIFVNSILEICVFCRPFFLNSKNKKT